MQFRIEYVDHVRYRISIENLIRSNITIVASFKNTMEPLDVYSLLINDCTV